MDGARGRHVREGKCIHDFCCKTSWKKTLKELGVDGNIEEDLNEIRYEGL
jgi:hypothetical protein